MGNKTSKPTAVRRVATGLAVLGALVLSSGVALMVTAGPSSAADCVPAAAYTETVNHPAETHVVHHPAVEAIPSQWWNWAPNDQQAPFDGPPAFPTDARGVWIAHGSDGGGPAGTGTFHTGTDNGHAPWFHRSDAVAGQAAYDETVTDRAAWVETINHPAVTCDTPPVVDPPTDTNTPTAVVVSPPKAHTPKAHTPKAATVTTPTVVHAGLSSVSTQDLRGEQGLALMVAGMVMLVAAGGLGLRVRGVASRI
jgi:hypothetical protein